MRTIWFAGAALALACTTAWGWNDRGHMLVAMVAYRELRPEVRERVNEILRHHPQYAQLKEGEPTAGPEQDRWVFMRAATWPDMVRSPNNPLHSAEHHGPWHYINYPVNREGKQGPEPVETWSGIGEPANLVQAMGMMEAQLKADATAEDRRAIDVCWVEHLIGDIHQPLHAVALFSSVFPEGDRGGNSFAVRRGDTPTNLHSYWDGVLGNGVEAPSLEAQVEGWWKNPAMDRGVLLGASPCAKTVEWARESAAIAEAEVYLGGALKGVAHTGGKRGWPQDTPALPSGYEEKAKHLAARRVVVAGYCLADSLNAWIGEQPAAAVNAQGARLGTPRVSNEEARGAAAGEGRAGLGR